MAFSKKSKKTSKPKPHLTTDLRIPNHFRCPISLDLIKDPVTAATGITYDRPSIEAWLDTGNSTCPVTHQPLPSLDLVPNHSLRRIIQHWSALHGVPRIPTPKVPITLHQALDALFDVSTHKTPDTIAKVRALSKESERNRKCFASAGAARLLSKLFNDVSHDTVLVDEILAALVCFLPFESHQDFKPLCSSNSLTAFSSALKFGDLSSRLNTIEILKEVVSSSKEVAKVASGTNGLIEGVVEMIKTPVSSKAMKASLMVTYYLTEIDSKAIRKLVELGIVGLVLELLVDAEKSVSEKALLVFDVVCSSEEGREEAFGNALTIPVLVKKMFRVSDQATECVISSMWKLCKNDRRGGGGVLSEAMQVGAFQKVLLLLQVGCSLVTKEKASDLLRMMNSNGGKFDCVDVSDFKGLKRSM